MDQWCKSLGFLTVSLPTPESVLKLDFDFVQPDIPMILGLDILDSHGLQLLNTETEHSALKAVKKGWRITVVRQDGHAFIRRPNDFHIILSRSQLERLHRHSAHLSAVKLPLMTLRECSTCHAYSLKPVIFQVRFRNEVVFNQEVSLDICWLKKTRPSP
jgi:hypothetical protein